LATGVALLASVYLLFAIVQPFSDLGPNIFYIPIFARAANATGARSSFVEPLPVIVGEPGDRYEIAVVSGATPDPGVTPRVIEVQPGTAIFVERPGATVPPGSSVAVVRPGDIVVISGGANPAPSPPAGTSAAPTPSPTV